MAKLVVVENDTVQGTDTHNISGMTMSPPTPVAYTGTGKYDYVGKMTDSLSTFVTIDGKPVAIVTSKSSLDPGESAPPTGRHSGPMGSSLSPTNANPVTLIITDLVGTGVPNSGAGSAFVTIDGAKVLLDGDKIDTCDGLSATGNSTVTAVGQSFVNCS